MNPGEPINVPLIPERASNFANHVDAIFYTLTALTAFFTILVLGLLVFLAYRYRRGSNVDRSRPVHHHLGLELTWSIIPLVMGLAVFVWSAIPYSQAFKPTKDAIQIYVIGKRWMWHVQHENGIRENNEMHIPIGKTVQVSTISQDVIHGFFVPEFRIKRDAIPGRWNTMQFTATKVGKYHLFCTEYCGQGHSRMAGWVYVMPPADYEAWLANGGAQVVRAKQTLEDLGAKIYEQMACGSCHDKDGIGRGPILTGIYGKQVRKKDGTLTLADTAYLRESILFPSDDIVAGYQQVMPSYKDQLDEEQVLQVIAYIKSLGQVRETPSSATPATATKPAKNAPPKVTTARQ